ncbi:hypothetical protein NEOC95_001348 [Neochlamydia sp. AcF95]|nr:hypothetical protein [Neochlamydia sp. AcF95]
MGQKLGLKFIFLNFHLFRQSLTCFPAPFSLTMSSLLLPNFFLNKL